MVDHQAITFFGYADASRRTGHEESHHKLSQALIYLNARFAPEHHFHG
jgi:hypothetical protein